MRIDEDMELKHTLIIKYIFINRFKEIKMGHTKDDSDKCNEFYIRLFIGTRNKNKSRLG